MRTSLQTRLYKESSVEEIASLSNRELLERIARIVAREREATATLVALLAEMDARKLYLELGFSSLFAYCTSALHLSEHAAYGRIGAARASHRFPEILDRLADGSLHLTAIILLAPVLNERNRQCLLEETRHKSRREVEKIVARLRPAPAVPSLVQRLPGCPDEPAPISANPTAGPSNAAPAPGPSPAPDSSLASDPPLVPDPSTTSELVPPTQPVPLRLAAKPIIAPLAPDRYRVQFTASAAMHERLCRAQAILRHKVPDGDVAAILDLALIALLEKAEARKFGKRKTRPHTSPPPDPSRAPDQTGRPPSEPSKADSPAGRESTEPRKTPVASRSRHIPAKVRREVWKRDQGRCAFVGIGGRRCEERAFLEFHHREPFACGGPSTTANVELRCRPHNVHEAETRFGKRRRDVPRPVSAN